MVDVASRRLNVSQRDRAPAHTSHLVRNWLCDNLGTFWFQELCGVWFPSTSVFGAWSKWFTTRGLNLLDYFVRSTVESAANKTRHSSVTSLRSVTEAAFTNMESALLKRAFRSFRSWMVVAIAADGRYINDFTLEISLYLCERVFFFVCILCNKFVWKELSLSDFNGAFCILKNYNCIDNIAKIQICWEHNWVYQYLLTKFERKFSGNYRS